MFRQLFPILATADMERSLAFYRDLLDGEIEYRFPDDGPAYYVGLTLGDSRLGIGWDPEIDRTGPVDRTTLWVYADDCDLAVQRLSAAGVPVIAPAEDQPWGERVARVQDPDGNVVVIGASSTASAATSARRS